MKISLLCPTRGRPRNVVRMTESVLHNASSNHETEIVFFVDNDDEETLNTVTDLRRAFGAQVTGVRGDRNRNIAMMHNFCAKKASGDVLGLSDDDVVYRTSGWNDLVADAFAQYPDNIVLVYGRDGLHDANHATHPFIHRTWMETTNYFVPEYFAGDYADTWLVDVARRIGRFHFIPELYTEHMHPAAAKAVWDSTYEERFALQATQNPGQKFLETAHEREADAKKLIRKIAEYQLGKAKA